MQDTILSTLKALEKEHSIRILYACESGSRAWGFPSVDSDFDVRFIYAHSRDWYLSIDDRRDVLELPVNEILDINGWEVRKSLRLFRSSNPPVYEWLQSPIVYKKDPQFLTDMQSLMPSCFSLRAGAYHYFSMAYNVFTGDLQGDEVRLKKYFYALRPLLALMWILEKKELPPMEFGRLRTLVSDKNWHGEVDRILSMKAEANEKSVIPQIPVLREFIAGGISSLKDKINLLAKQDAATNELSNLFRSLLR